MSLKDSSCSICLSSLVILAASDFEISCGKQTDRQTPVKTLAPRLSSAWVVNRSVCKTNAATRYNINNKSIQVENLRPACMVWGAWRPTRYEAAKYKSEEIDWTPVGVDARESGGHCWLPRHTAVSPSRWLRRLHNG